MNTNTSLTQALTSHEFMDGLIRFAFISTLVLLCFRVFNPFVSLMIWSLVLAVTLYPLHQSIAARLGGNQGRAATLLIVAGLLLVGVPVVSLALSFADHITSIYAAWQAGTIAIPDPNPAVAQWPLVGERLFALWADAADNIEAFLITHKDSLEELGRRTLGYLGSSAGAVLFFVAAYIVAGIMMAYGASGSAAMYRIICRIAGPVAGPEVHTLATLTTRSVAVGVLGVALIQALILGVGFMFAGVPAAGILALVVLFFGILQLPALLISLPVIAYLWMVGDASGTSNVIWTVYMLVGGASDNVLKPMLLGRGVDAPMPVILLGALGGMVSAGIIGLFLGAVILAVGYQVFMKWVDAFAEHEAAETADSAD
ncbi:AI-2E family transporter [Halieaceae bacterium IMCC14734]|uniref:AI-2E family transporter n=1 Tax=Candidatus Litorirhabdus singularis TaxID=2518993 RepID=A0ABT3TMJ5_9GAMM|nr:AI-2E family transporter [Candidatus Litorirhabdus singularis]MCX2982547.1 AI-2E family transporter [Candidatus Litorirhabdus singularis]